MLISLMLILLITAGGFALSYLIESDEPFLWRAAAGLVVGSSIYGTITFVLACFFGLTAASPIALILTLAPLILFRDKARWKQFKIDWQRATNKMQGGSWAKFLRFAFYALFFLVFCFLFAQAMFQTPAGIYTGGAQNGGDLPFHLGAIFSFTDGANFPPQNPSYAGATFSYPFIADIVTAGFMKFGADVRSAMLIQDVAWAFALLVVLERFVFRLTADRLAGKIAPWLLFFSGGLGFIWFFGDYWTQGKGFFEFLNNLPKDYTIGDVYRWGNSLTTLFLTQRSLLLGMPLTIIIFQWLWERYTSEKGEKGKSKKVGVDASHSSLPLRLFPFSPFLLGLIAGMLPLVHMHSLIVLFVVTVFLLGLDPENWRTWISFGIGVCVIAVPELVWSIHGSASHASQFIDWHYGWAKGDDNIFWFWLKNTGLIIPMSIIGLIVTYTFKENDSNNYYRRMRSFASPFLLLFIIANAIKLAPWEWDNIKVLIYCFVGGIPFVALALSWAWNKGKLISAAAAVVFLSLIFSGAIDVWRTASGQIKFLLFNPDSVRIAEQIKAKTPPNALFLNAPTYNTAVALTGRQSLMRYTGNLFSYGIDYAGREADVKTIYSGGPAADALLSKYGIDYVIISKEEDTLSPNRAFFSKFPMVAESGSAHVYKVR